jgi:hypothetical protein
VRFAGVGATFFAARIGRRLEFCYLGGEGSIEMIEFGLFALS